VELISAVLLEQTGDPRAPAARPDEADLDRGHVRGAILSAGSQWAKNGGSGSRLDKPPVGGIGSHHRVVHTVCMV